MQGWVGRWGWRGWKHEFLGGGPVEDAMPLQYQTDETWQVTLVIPQETVPNAEIVYGYFLREADGSIWRDWGNDRVINPAGFSAREVLIIDAWNPPGSIENAFY